MPDPPYGHILNPLSPAAHSAWSDPLDETVVHDPSGRPWLVCTADTLSAPDGADPTCSEETSEPAGRYETQVYYTARAGLRGFSTGYSQRYLTRAAALRGHRQWCLHVRTGEVLPDQAPDDPA